MSPGGRVATLPTARPVGAALPMVERRSSRPGTGVGAMMLLVLTLGALAHVAVRIKGFEVGYALGRERKARVELEEQRRRLRLELGVLKDPGRIMVIARDRLGLGPPAPGEIVDVAGLATAVSPVAAEGKADGVAVRSAASGRSGH